MSDVTDVACPQCESLVSVDVDALPTHRERPKVRCEACGVDVVVGVNDYGVFTRGVSFPKRAPGPE